MIHSMLGAGILTGMFILTVVGVLIVVVIIGALLTIRKVKAGEAGVRTGLGGLKVTKSWMLRMPFVHRWDIMDIQVKKLEVARKGKDGLICQDNIRADIEVAFYVRVSPEVENIMEVAEAVGCERASEIELLRNLFEAKFSDALKAAGKRMEFEKLYTMRTEFRNDIIKEIGQDLNGYKLEDVAIDYLEQTSRDDHDPDNVLDAQGIKKINDITSGQTEMTNERTRKMEVEVETQNVQADVEKREQERKDEEDKAVKQRQIEEARAREAAEARKVIEASRNDQEQAALSAQEEIDVRGVEKERTVMSANYSKDQDLKRLEQETIEAGEQAEVDRGRRIGLATQEKEAVVIKKAEEVAESRAGLESKEKEVTIQTQNRLDAEADMHADRTKRVMLVDANARAEASLVADVKKAEAQRQAEQELAEMEKFKRIVAADAARESADRTAEEIQTLAAAEANASEKKNHAMQQEAEGTAAMKAAEGIAEARVTTAKADAKKADADAEKVKGMAEAEVIEAQGTAGGKAKSAEGRGEGDAIDAVKTAEAAGLEAKGLAEAKAKLEMAKSNAEFQKAGQEHEEFRLQLNKDRDVDLAEIQIQKDVAEAQARVVGEALKSANIDIVGGDNDFFEKVVSSVTQGKAVDRLMNNSQTLSDVKNTFFNGDPEYFKAQLRNWVQGLGVSSEDVKNLTISALLTKLIAKSDDSSVKGLMRSAQKAVRESGLGDTLASLLLEDKAAK